MSRAIVGNLSRNKIRRVRASGLILTTFNSRGIDMNEKKLAQIEVALENFCVWFAMVGFCVLWWIG